MTRSSADRLTWMIVGLAAVASAVAFVVTNVATARSVATGAAIGVANWMLLRYIVGRVVDGNVRRQGGFLFVLFIKLGALVGLVYLLLRAGVVEPLPFAVGISTMAAGALMGAAMHILGSAPAESER
ncbi:MAG: ATP synthase subunit I [Myxococcales bacterium]|nr:ATP synthase subunit I [Myxococcales bacterium]